MQTGHRVRQEWFELLGTLRLYCTERISQLGIEGMISPGILTWKLKVSLEFPLTVSPTSLTQFRLLVVVLDPARYSTHSSNLILGFIFVEDWFEMLTTTAAVSPVR